MKRVTAYFILSLIKGLFIITVFIYPTFFFASTTRDSLQKERSACTDPIKKALITADLIKIYGPRYDSIESKGAYYAEQFVKEKNKYGEMIVYYTLCRSGVEFAKYEASREYGQKTIFLAYQIQNDSIIGRTWLSLGFSYYSQGDFQLGIGSYLKALAVCEKHSNDITYKKIMASAYNGLGLCFSVKPYPNNDKALAYYLKALKIDEETNNTRDWGLVLIRLGILYTNIKEYKRAEEYLIKAIDFANKSKMPVLQKWSLESMATFHRNKGEFGEALKNYYLSLQISKSQSEVPGIISSYVNICETYIGLKDRKLALNYLDSGYWLGVKNRIYEPIFKIHAIRSEIHKAKGDFAKALEFHVRSVELKDSLFSERSNNQIQETETRYKTQKQEKELIEKSAELVIQKEKSERQAAQRNVFVGGIFVLLITVVLIYRQNRIKSKANEIIRSQKLLVEAKNKDITDSIKYAKKIQEAILPPKELRAQLFPQSFVLFQPRDIVSGDFYWFNTKNGKRIIAAVDCTGHGVPGAFMSMIGNTFLTEVIEGKGITDPAAILSEMRHLVIKALKQSDDAKESKDGMDMALLCIDDEKGILEFAGANNPLWMIRNGECIEYKADSYPIGYYRGTDQPFTNHKIEFKEGDTFYIFTDGYADQFGGPKGKKLKYKPFKSILISAQKESMFKQEEVLHNTFEEWKGSLDQVDDVLVIGVRV